MPKWKREFRKWAKANMLPTYVMPFDPKDWRAAKVLSFMLQQSVRYGFVARGVEGDNGGFIDAGDR